MSDVFDTLPTGGTAPKAEAPANDARKQKLAEMKASFRESLAGDPTFAQRIHTLSDAIEVTNSLGFGENGNIVVDKSKPVDKDGKKPLATTSAIVGYRVKNVGTEPISYQTEVYTQDADGKFVGQKVEKVLAPGQTCDLARAYMTMFCARPEISFTLANGKVIRGSSKKTAGDIKEELEAYYFAFNKDLGIQINGDDVKLNVGEKVGDKWVVSAEYLETFGYLNNTVEKARAGRKADGPRYSSSDLAANYVQKMLENAGM